MEIRDLKQEDLGSMVRWRNDATVNRYLADRLKSMEEACAWYERMRADSRVWLKAIVQDDRLIGYATVESLDEANRKCELALVIGEPGEWGKGIGQFVLAEMLRYAFETLRMHRVWAAVVDGNERSERLVKSAGFVKEGVMRETILINGQYANLLCYSILENEYTVRTDRF